MMVCRQLAMYYLGKCTISLFSDGRDFNAAGHAFAKSSIFSIFRPSNCGTAMCLTAVSSILVLDPLIYSFMWYTVTVS